MEKKLIEAVRRRTVLYDTSDVNYMKTKLKQQLWEEIAKEIGLKTGAEAKIMWEKLRHSFRDAIRRQRKCIRSGAAATTQKPWKFQKEMGFLQRYMANRKRETNFTDASDQDTQTQDYEVLENEADFEVGSEADSVVLEHTERDSEDISPTNLRSTSIEKTPTVPRQETASNIPGCSMNKKSRQSQVQNKDNIGSLLKRSIEHREKRAADRAMKREIILDKMQPTSDPLYHFFMSMYETTTKMPPASQHRVRNDIYKAVSHEEATLLNIPQAITMNLAGRNTCDKPEAYETTAVQYQNSHNYNDYQGSSSSTPFSTYSDSSHHVSNFSPECPEVPTQHILSEKDRATGASELYK